MRALALSLVLLAAPSLATAQAPSPAEPAAGAAGPERVGGFAECRRERLEAMRTALKLRPDQEAAFQTFVDETRPNPAMRERMRAERERLADAGSEERAQARAAAAPEIRAWMERRRAATERFLAVLTPDQKTAFWSLRPARRDSAAPSSAESPPPPA